MLRFGLAPISFSLTIVFVLRITLADAMRSMDVPVSCVPGLLIRMFPFPIHVSFYFTVLDL